MKRISANKGATLVELLIVMGIFGMVLAAMMSQYVTLLKTTTAARKITKSENDVTNVVWPLFKEIESAGFGVPSKGLYSSTSCLPDTGRMPISLASGVLTIHSMAAGDKKGAGAWSTIDSNCGVTGIPDNEYVIVIDPVDRSRLGFSNVAGSRIADPCPANATLWSSALAFWTPSGSGSNECYETKFSVSAYTTANPAPVMCATGTNKVSRSASATSASSYQPMLDCVLALDYRFGCINKTSGDLSWRSDISCTGTEGSLRLIRVGIIFQESPRADSQGDPTITLFSDLSSASTINLTSDQRYYKWRRIERTIALRNLE